jgi:uncharacterized protein (DUF488 family)
MRGDCGRSSLKLGRRPRRGWCLGQAAVVWYASRTVDELRDYVRYERIALLCFEADQRRCHRDVVLAELLRRSASALVLQRFGQ